MNLEKETREVLQKIFNEKIVRECDLDSPQQIVEFRRKVQPLINSDIVHCEKRNNPNDLFEEEYHYSLTEYGERLQNLQPAKK